MSLQLVRGVDGHLTHFTTYFRQTKTIAIVSTSVSTTISVREAATAAAGYSLVQLHHHPATTSFHYIASRSQCSAAATATRSTVDIMSIVRRPRAALYAVVT